MDPEITAALGKFHAVWPRVGGGLEVANESYDPPSPKKKNAALYGRQPGSFEARLCALAVLLLIVSR